MGATTKPWKKRQKKQAIAIATPYKHDTYDGTYTTEKYYVSGTITEVTNTTYGNLYITDGNGNTFLIYGVYSEDGATRYDKLTVKPIKGDVITVYGTLGAYGQTIQMNAGWLTAHTPHTHDYAPATCTAASKCTICDDITGDPLGHIDENADNTCDRTGCGASMTVTKKDETITVAGSTGTQPSDKKSISWTSDNFTITNEQAGSTTAIRTSDSDHFRVYQSSKLTIASNDNQQITQVVITCTSADYATACANSFNAISGISATASGTTVTITVDAGSVTSITATATKQFRIKTLVVTYS